MIDCLEVNGASPEEIEEIVKSPDAKDLLDAKKKELERQKKLVRMQRQRFTENMTKINSHPEGPVEGLRSLLTNDLRNSAPWSNVEYRTKSIMGQTYSLMVDVVRDLRTTWFGFRSDRTLANDMIREIFGTHTGSKQASILARQWRVAAETLRDRFNRAGGDIGKLKSWGMPQSHDQAKVYAAGRDEWISFIEPRLANAEDVDLDYIYETISTGGLNKEKPMLYTGGKLANRRRDHRILHLKDGDAWLEYNERFGRTDDALTIFEDHIRGMAQDIASLEILGPNPRNMFDLLQHEVSRMDQNHFPGYTEAIYRVVSGEVDETAALISTPAKALEAFGATTRALQVMSKLGSATLSSITDIGTLFANVMYHGMSPTKMVRSIAKTMTSTKTHEEIARIGFALEIFNSHVTSRFDEVGRGLSAQASEAVMRASGLNWWTEALRKAWQYEFYHHLKSLPEDHSIWKAYGGWTDDEGRLLEIVNQEGDYAIMIPTARVRAVTTAGAKRGTALGELVRTGTQFKSFPATFMIQQMGRIFMSRNSLKGRIAYAASLLTSTTILGALAMEMKDRSKGYEQSRKGSPLRSSKPEDQAAYWAAAAIQGGGLGFIGDLVFSDQNRFGGSVLSTLSPPAAGTIENFTKLTVGNIQEAVKGDETHFGSEFIEFVDREINPLNLWYTRALMEEYIIDTLKEAVDDDYARVKRRKARRRRRDYGQTKGF